jgi:hypothetical protein
MEAEHERELRQWADALAGAAEAERRAMGKAILMLLDRIENLRAELERTAHEPPPQPAEPAATEAEVSEQATGELPAADRPGKDTTVAGLRERIGAAVHRVRD